MQVLASGGSYRSGSRDNARGGHSYGTMLGAEEETARLREECGEGWDGEELGCPGAQDVCRSMGPEQSGAIGMRGFDPGSPMT